MGSSERLSQPTELTRLTAVAVAGEAIGTGDGKMSVTVLDGGIG